MRDTAVVDRLLAQPDARRTRGGGDGPRQVEPLELRCSITAWASPRIRAPCWTGTDAQRRCTRMLPVLTVKTAGGAAYSVEYRDLGGAGKQLSVLRHGGPDDPPETNKPMDADRWYRVTMLTPLPPEIGTQVAMVLDPDGGTDPIVRYSTMVMSVVGTL